MSNRVLVVQHVPWEGPGLIEQPLVAAGLQLECRTFVNDPSPQVPTIDELAGLVVMGGPMGADQVEKFPGLGIELDLIRRAVDAELPVLGICLGHQLIAHAFGAQLECGAGPEYGMCEVTIDGIDPVIEPLGALGERATVLQWHDDVAQLPPGAQLLASSSACPNQAFRLGSALGMQFHAEIDAIELDRWLSIPAMAGGFPPAIAGQLPSAMKATEPQLRPAALACFGAFAQQIVG
ncbi:MAG: type 1 glutamine amidotransferase [Candidatus Nanopelagicales bacterium]